MSDTWFICKESPEMISKCFQDIKSTVNNSDVQIMITAKPKKQSRSDAQRRLVNAWYDQWSAFTGEARSIERNRIMYKCGLDIFYRDNIQINGVYSADTIDCIKLLKAKGFINEYNHMMMDFCSKITSSSFTVKQNAEYIENVWRFSLSKEVSLYVPSDCVNSKFEA